MKTKYWLLCFALLAVICALFTLPLLGGEAAEYAEIYSGGTLIKTVALSIDQEFTVDGRNTVTVKDGRIAVTWAECPDQYCVKRGFRSSGGDIVCLPNRLVIRFAGEQEIDAVS
ncbi:MAG: NusG domain II-containing protein [Oscillospiraceae bacterium]|nr:NusG domain II-containing protein [Oscillospiraceae bacterium]